MIRRTKAVQRTTAQTAGKRALIGEAPAHDAGGIAQGKRTPVLCNIRVEEIVTETKRHEVLSS
jgi:hypothetical protein